MAESIETEEQPNGFDPSKLTEENQNIDEYLCAICKYVMREPIMAAGCEHFFCYVCINKSLLNKQTCPIDRQPLVSQNLRRPFRHFQTHYEKLKIKCDYESIGCGWIDTLQELEAHLNECEYKPNGECKKCGLKKSDPTNHDCIESLKLKNEGLEIKIIDFKGVIEKLRCDNSYLTEKNEKEKKESEQKIEQLMQTCLETNGTNADFLVATMSKLVINRNVTVSQEIRGLFSGIKPVKPRKSALNK